MKKALILVLAFLPFTAIAQKKALEHTDYDLWNTIEQPMLAPDGTKVLFTLERGEKDHFFKVKGVDGTLIFEHDRSPNALFNYDSNYVLFTIKAWKDSVIAMKSRKVKKEDLPKDSLGILNLNTKEVTKIPRVKSFKVPEEWSGYLAYTLEKEQKDPKEKEKDSTANKTGKATKKVGKKNGFHVVLRNLNTKNEDTLRYVTHYTFAKKGEYFAYSTTGSDKKSNSGVILMNLKTQESDTIYTSKKGSYTQLNFSETGERLAFVVDTDTTKVQVRPNALYHWKKGLPEAELLVNSESAPEGYLVSADGKVHFSKDESKLYFGLRKPPVFKDTTLTDEEIVNVEVWTYNEPRLYTVQELQLKNDTVRSYTTAVHLKNKKLVPVADNAFPESELGDEGNSNIALVGTKTPYELQSQWTGYNDYDYRVVDVLTGDAAVTISKTERLRLSPKAKFAFGYSRKDTTWVTFDTSSGVRRELTKNKVFYNEWHDYPDHPYPYGYAGFTADDKAILLYDRYDIWQFDPKTGEGQRLTKGREQKTRYRYIKLDEEERFLDPKSKWLLSTFDETTKNAGFVYYDARRDRITPLVSGPYRYANAKKAKRSDQLIFTRESFQEFPDLRTADADFKKVNVLSNANPQQSDYNWGTIELMHWTSLDGKALTGLLVKPENFDSDKKYPLLVNFYERSSDRLHRHRIPRAERSSINYSFYTSRGYVIFNPDVAYREGYPGESAYNCVIPGVTSLIEKGFIDKDNIGVQGHSWGGYQIAYLVTKTDIFKAAESGAPVPNMISAYGGIRWWTGLSRQFQYEHTQSRIGGTPWEYPTRYIENSPIFNIDKINTPLLIMHNDADGHVPWYQGIEFFVSLRRLGKPSWFLNYNGEPHWPLKLQNRKDFNIRMAQFFDHYLKGAPKPVWMERGVPALEKGVYQGLELLDED